MISRDRPEPLVIRPPSEWRSLLVRVTRGCPWNRCRFCGIYPALWGTGHEARSVEEVGRDIALARERLRRAPPGTVFLGDADPLGIGTDDLVEILGRLRATFPTIRRVTAYARLSTLLRKGEEDLARLARAGLTRVHAGLESGSDAVLRYQRKGLTAKAAIEAGRRSARAGLEVSLYVLLGLGGRDREEEHVAGTARVINAIDPRFVRFRRLWIYDEPGIRSPLLPEIARGAFTPQDPEGTVRELRGILARLDGVGSEVVCDHANNYVEVTGRLPDGREGMLSRIDAFLALPAGERALVYERTGSRI